MAPGEYVVRDQEHMIQYVAQSCADAVGVRVIVRAALILSDGASESHMALECIAEPVGETGKISRFAVQP